MARYRKFVAAFLAFAGVIVSAGLLDGAAQAWASTIVSAVGAAAVYLVENERDDDPTDPPLHPVP